jgi:hypothetical protein
MSADAPHSSGSTSKKEHFSMSHKRVNQRLAVPVVYVAAMFLSIMDTTIVNVALPTLGRFILLPRALASCPSPTSSA